MLEIYTDGSAGPTNPGPGGFGVVVVSDGEIITYHSERCEQTTNNREEIKGILWALENYGKLQTPIIYSDSNYCVQTFNDWMYSWERKGWKKSNNKTPENLDLIQKVYNLTVYENYMMNLVKVKGHSGLLYNELADKLAKGEKIEL